MDGAGDQSQGGGGRQDQDGMSRTAVDSNRSSIAQQQHRIRSSSIAAQAIALPLSTVAEHRYLSHSIARELFDLNHQF